MKELNVPVFYAPVTTQERVYRVLPLKLSARTVIRPCADGKLEREYYFQPWPAASRAGSIRFAILPRILREVRTRVLESFRDKLQNLTEYKSRGHISWVC